MTALSFFCDDAVSTAIRRAELARKIYDHYIGQEDPEYAVKLIDLDGDTYIIVNDGADEWLALASDYQEKLNELIDSILAGNHDEDSGHTETYEICLLYTSPSPRDQRGSRMPSSA